MITKKKKKKKKERKRKKPGIFLYRENTDVTESGKNENAVPLMRTKIHNAHISSGGNTT